VAPQTCCYSNTASCIAEEFGHEFSSTDRKECKKTEKQPKRGVRSPLSTTKGEITNYRYQSDFVLAEASVCGPLKTFNIFKNTQSVQSDHEMVYMITKCFPYAKAVNEPVGIAGSEHNECPNIQD
jgi:hypothetical protein